MSLAQAENQPEAINFPAWCTVRRQPGSRFHGVLREVRRGCSPAWPQSAGLSWPKRFTLLLSAVWTSIFIYFCFTTFDVLQTSAWKQSCYSLTWINSWPYFFVLLEGFSKVIFIFLRLVFTSSIGKVEISLKSRVVGKPKSFGNLDLTKGYKID